MVVNTIVEDLGLLFRDSNNDEMRAIDCLLRVVNKSHNNIPVPLTIRTIGDLTNTNTFADRAPRSRTPDASKTTFRQAVSPVAAFGVHIDRQPHPAGARLQPQICIPDPVE